MEKQEIKEKPTPQEIKANKLLASIRCKILKTVDNFQAPMHQHSCRKCDTSSDKRRSVKAIHSKMKLRETCQSQLDTQTRQTIDERRLKAKSRCDIRFKTLNKDIIEMMKAESIQDDRIQTTDPKTMRESKSGSTVFSKETPVSNLRSRESLTKLTNRLK